MIGFVVAGFGFTWFGLTMCVVLMGLYNVVLLVLYG